MQNSDKLRCEKIRVLGIEDLPFYGAGVFYSTCGCLFELHLDYSNPSPVHDTFMVLNDSKVIHVIVSLSLTKFFRPLYFDLWMYCTRPEFSTKTTV